MSNELESIKLAFESLGMTPEQIAEDRALDLVSVKAALAQSSSVYRKQCGQEEPEEDDLNFSNEDLRRVNNVIKEIALGAEDDNLRLKAAMYIRDDKKGRREVMKAVGNSGMNILMFNQFMQKTRAVSDGVKSAILGDSQNGVVNV
jgi:hypothetical protein